MLYTAIDIGTNTVLLLIAEIKKDSGAPRLSVVHEEQRFPRLGKDVDADKQLHPDSMQRVLSALQEYQQFLQSYIKKGKTVAEPVVTATSAVRDAANREEFLQLVKSHTGWNVKLLSGHDEARFTYSGALSMTSGDMPENADHAIVIDIGGGSTEIAFGRKDAAAPDLFESVNAGCVRFTERFQLNQVSGSRLDAQTDACYTAAKACFEGLDEIRKTVENAKGKLALLGVAGTLTSLAWMQHHERLKTHQSYDANLLNGIVLTLEELRHWRKYVAAAGPEQLIAEFPLVMKGRADVFLAGLIILEAFMDFFQQTELLVSTGGIRHGALLNATSKQ
jgi:exopolyphosphatase/guanosine-5'-triphosphate,3'-diphosphate pyrophosphatase